MLFMSLFLSIFANMNRKKIVRWTKIILMIYLLGGIALYFLQDAILFHPVTLKRDHNYNFREPHEDISIAMNKEDTLSLVRFFSTVPEKKGVVLYFHGNKKNISWYAKYPPYFTRHGYEVIIIDYPGFGKSTGKLTEKILYDWSKQLYKYARTLYAADSIIIYGKSMGTGIAAHLASIENCKRLILETPYYDFPSVIRTYLPIYPVSSMLHYQLPTYQYLPHVEAPVTIFHGTDDWTVSYKNSKRLKPLLKPTDELISIEGGSHNDLYTYKLTIQKLDSLLRL
jgi:alpha-beta hydrolase superfamily lysophospholipase